MDRRGQTETPAPIFQKFDKVAVNKIQNKTDKTGGNDFDWQVRRLRRRRKRRRKRKRKRRRRRKGEAEGEKST